MFDRDMGGNWVVWYRNPYTAKLERTARMKKRAAFDRYEMFGGVAIEKVGGLFKRKIERKILKGL